VSPFPNYPLPERFRNYEDAMNFIEKPDWSLCIPIYLTKQTKFGPKTYVNPEYSEAPFEQKVIFGKYAILIKKA
jgi:hypothetical protein